MPYLFYAMYKIIRPELVYSPAAPLRPLTPYERTLLQDRFMDVLASRRHARRYLWRGGTLLLASIIIILATQHLPDIPRALAYISFTVVGLLGVYWLIRAIYIINSSYYLTDLVNQVYIVRGPVYTGVPIGGGTTGISGQVWDFKVGKWSFSHDMVLEEYRHTAQQLNDGDMVEVEFSPKSKFVWKLRNISRQCYTVH